jgi:hypothetical protein
MRRIVLVLSAAALVAAIMAFSSVSAFAQPVCTDTPPGPGGTGQWTQTCVETEVVSEEVRTPTTESCEVGNSGRQGTQEGDLVRTDQVTYQTTTTQLYQGNPANGNAIGEPSVERVEVGRVEGEESFEPTGPCRNIPGRPTI